RDDPAPPPAREGPPGGGGCREARGPAQHRPPGGDPAAARSGPDHPGAGGAGRRARCRSARAWAPRRRGRDARRARQPPGRGPRPVRPGAPDRRDRARTRLGRRGAAGGLPACGPLLRPRRRCSGLNSASALANPGRLGYRGREQAGTAAMTDPLDDLTRAISPTEEIIDEARNGRMFILIDEEDRENEGDLVIPAQMCTPNAINFMATHGRGLICLTLTSQRIDALGLSLMSTKNSSRHETAFTVSIEAREGVSTGISAHDRALTVAVAIDPTKGPADIATPGHIFPLRARDGGVLVRAGHTEAATDIARLAGLNPAGVICEIMN